MFARQWLKCHRLSQCCVSTSVPMNHVFGSWGTLPGLTNLPRSSYDSGQLWEMGALQANLAILLRSL